MASDAPPAASSASFDGYFSRRTTSVLPPFSSKVTVVTDPPPPPPPSSVVHASREWGCTSTYVPKNATGSAPPTSKTSRYLPPTRGSVSQDSSFIPIDLGTHHRLSSSALVNASNTMRAGPLTVRVTTTSRSDFSTVVRFFTGPGLPSILAFIALYLSGEFLDNLVQRREPFAPPPAVALEPRRLSLQAARAQPPRPHASDFLRRDEPRLLQHADVLLHARERHLELLGQVRDRRVGAAEVLQHAAPRGVGERGERGIKAGVRILNHMVQYTRGTCSGQGGWYVSELLHPAAARTPSETPHDLRPPPFRSRLPDAARDRRRARSRPSERPDATGAIPRASRSTRFPAQIGRASC